MVGGRDVVLTKREEDAIPDDELGAPDAPNSSTEDRKSD